MTRTYWTEEKLQELEELLTKYSVSEIAKILNKSKKSISSAKRNYNIVVSEVHKKVIHKRIMKKKNGEKIGDKNPNWKGGISKNNYAYKKKQKEKYPEKIKARNIVYRAVKSNKLNKKPCEFCGDKNVVAHHDDYAFPLMVRWVCRLCHRYKIHGGKH